MIADIDRKDYQIRELKAANDALDVRVETVELQKNNSETYFAQHKAEFQKEIEALKALLDSERKDTQQSIEELSVRLQEREASIRR